MQKIDSFKINWSVKSDISVNADDNLKQFNQIYEKKILKRSARH
jgi:hypothetical protein